MKSLDMINAQQCKLSDSLEAYPSGTPDEICRLSNDRRAVLYDLARLNNAIEADPEAVSAHHKELWRRQAKAMQEYVDILGERIKDLIDNN